MPLSINDAERATWHANWHALLSHRMKTGV